MMMMMIMIIKMLIPRNSLELVLPNTQEMIVITAMFFKSVVEVGIVTLKLTS